MPEIPPLGPSLPLQVVEKAGPQPQRKRKPQPRLRSAPQDPKGADQELPQTQHIDQFV
ncbi:MULTISPECIES: hypothetical protein [Methylomonas]|uniref:hypothetical protein n=1 Tax=Methylomonas TaxID=416 RepID=UPI001681A6C7|nr:hypothetical protein [Methylomonas rhizoryzae]